MTGRSDSIVVQQVVVEGVTISRPGETRYNML